MKNFKTATPWVRPCIPIFHPYKINDWKRPLSGNDAAAVESPASRKSADQPHDLMPLKDKNLPSGLFSLTRRIDRNKGTKKMWQVKVHDVASRMNRWGSYDSNEILRAAEEIGYTEVEETDNTITGIDQQGWETVIAEK